MPKTVDNYIIKKQLFRDSFGGKNASKLVQYFSCEHKILKKNFTLKKIEKAVGDCDSNTVQNHNNKLSFAYTCLQNEIQKSRLFKSEKIIKCLKLLKAKNSVYAVYEEHPQNSLEKLLRISHLTLEKKQNILNQVLLLVRELHAHNLVLGNLSPENLFFTEDYKLRISNFLLAKIVNDEEKIKIDSSFLDKDSIYYAPELLQTGSLNKATDIYSFGQIIKSLKFQNSNNELLSPVKFDFQHLKDLVEKMTDQNSYNRPSIEEIQKHFRLNKSRNKSTCGSTGSKDNQQKIADLKGLEGHKSQTYLKFFNEKTESKISTPHQPKKNLLSKRQSMNENIQLISPKSIKLKSRVTLNFDSPLEGSHFQHLQATAIKRQKEMEPESSQKLANTLKKMQSSFSAGCKKQAFKEIPLLRNLVSFLIEMVLFVIGQHNSKDLCFYLVGQALHFTKTLLKILEAQIKDDDVASKKLLQSIQECQKEKLKLLEIASFFNKEGQFKKSYELDLIEELRKFGKSILNAYLSDYCPQKNFSQVSDSSFKLKIIQSNQTQKIKQNEEKLFKTFMLLKRLEYGNYFDFFSAKIHHPNKKFWNEHYFQFQKTFGGKYFANQIKNLIARK